MRTEEIIIRLFCMVDDKLAHVNKRKNAVAYPWLRVEERTNEKASALSAQGLRNVCTMIPT